MVLSRSYPVLIYFFAIWLGGCSPLDALNALTPAAEYTQYRDVRYAGSNEPGLDVYTPTPNRARPRDVVIFIHGGRWRTGSKDQYRFVADAFAARGYIVIIPDFRQFPDADWTGMITRSAQAYRWTETHISRYGGNPDRIFLMGHSSGAHLAAMVAFDRRVREAAPAPCGFVGLAGPYDFLPIADNDVREVFRSAKNPSETQPITFADAGDPAALLLTGSNDTTVEPGNSARMAEKLADAGARVETISYPEVGHAGILAALAPLNSRNASVISDSIAFMKQVHCP